MKRAILTTLAMGACLALAGGAAAADEAAGASPLDKVLAAQPEDIRSRFPDRHPRETLEFFRIEPGMTVVEVLPGAGWYTRILVPYLGPDGRLIGVDYALHMYPLFNFYDAEYLEAKQTWIETWTGEVESWRGADGAAIDAFVFGSMPQSMAGTADAVLVIRALHNLARFEDQGGYLSTALADVHRVLKPGGIVGVVQHVAPESASDAWADGSNGYLKKSFVIARLEQAGFELVAESDVNVNPADQPTEQDVVWRLPPTLYTSHDKPELRAEYLDIGESTRMTLLFRKPE